MASSCAWEVSCARFFSLANKIGGGGGDVTANEREFTLMGGSESHAKTQRRKGQKAVGAKIRSPDNLTVGGGSRERGGGGCRRGEPAVSNPTQHMINHE